MSTVSEDGNWRTFGSGDPLLPEYLGPGENLCLRCGIHVYSDGVRMHNRWHERLGK